MKTKATLVYYLDKYGNIFDVFLMKDVKDAKGFIKFLKEDKKYIEFLKKKCGVSKFEIQNLVLGGNKRIGKYKI